jgi:hypothetical protein
MKTFKAMTIVCTVLVGILLYRSSSAAGGNPTSTTVDAPRPETWDTEIERIEKETAKIAEEAIRVAKDRKQPAEIRRKAVFTLGKLKTKKSLAFLVDNISLHVPMETIKGDEDTMKETPCMYVLWKGDWNTAKAVLDGLWAKDKTKTELLFFTEILKRILGERLAVAAVDDALFRTRDTQHKKNLTAIKTFLPEK